MAASRPSRGIASVDVDLRELPDELAFEEITSRLQVKGFCVVRTKLEPGTLEKALMEVRQMGIAGRWFKVNPAIQEGLLGQEGSSSIVELESPHLESEVRTDGGTLAELDAGFCDLHESLDENLENLGIRVTHRTLGILHQAGEPDQEPAPLTEKQVTKFLGQFMRHRLMVLQFLGPTVGTLELQPYATPDTEPHEVATVPGNMVLLRPDIMSHRHFAAGRAFVLSTFYLSGHMGKRQGNLIPPARQLDDWTLERLRQLKEADREDAVWNPDIPRDWQQAMNHMYHKGQIIAVRGAAIKAPVSDDPETFFMASKGGPDYAVDIPLSRWDHSQVYDEDPESWRYYKTYCHHAALMDGIDLFDCKFFSLTPNESKGMDPHQRLILEVGYSALANMGMRKSTLNGAHCGVYVGMGNTEWSVADKEMDFGAFGATGGALSISSGRFSFTLGLKGPSMTLDTEASSGASALYLAAESCQKKGRAASSDMAIAIAVHLLLTPLWWPSQCASGWLSRSGRCLSFDAKSDGYVRGDGTAAAAVKCLNQVVDGKVVSNENEPLVGSLAGAMMNNNGVGASLAAPYGPAEQEAVAEALRNACISPCDVDAVEAHGAGALLADAVEVGSLLRALRSEDLQKPLPITTVKSSVGNQVEVGSLASFIKGLYSLQWGCTTPNLHLRQANPHMDAFDQPCNLVDDSLEYSMSSTFIGVKSRGFGGSNAFLVGWGQVDASKVAVPPPTAVKDNIFFWPGGGGELEQAQLPQTCYKIAGTWSSWSVSHTMEAEAEGVYAYTVTLGENRWEHFQLWLDGDPSRALHPGEPMAGKDTPAFGPVDDVEDSCWMIDGRGGDSSSSTARPSGADDSAVVVAVGSPADRGLPGDQYRVRLRIVGKWRSVTWERLPCALDAGSVRPACPLGAYSVAGGWNDWVAQDMERGTAPGTFFIEVTVRGYGEEFQILRNGDWNQVLYPASPAGVADGSGEVLGPDDMGSDLFFNLPGPHGARYRVELVRVVDGEKDTRRVSWLRLP